MFKTKLAIEIRKDIELESIKLANEIADKLNEAVDKGYNWAKVLIKECQIKVGNEISLTNSDEFVDCLQERGLLKIRESIENLRRKI